ncbi:MAG TPA: hypothetical protein VM260_07795, partial [Pirellula sp.]|nr:hypothetical protein [Pirellula sp.]
MPTKGTLRSAYCLAVASNRWAYDLATGHSFPKNAKTKIPSGFFKSIACPFNKVHLRFPNEVCVSDAGEI